VWELDGIFNVDARWESMIGAEFNLAKIGYMRMGYRYGFQNLDLGPEVGASFGGGLRLGTTHVDYAFLPFGDLGMSHRVSLSWRWARSENKPAAP
jgi:hypothetical protein